VVLKYSVIIIGGHVISYFIIIGPRKNIPATNDNNNNNNNNSILYLKGQLIKGADNLYYL